MNTNHRILSKLKCEHEIAFALQLIALVVLLSNCAEVSTLKPVSFDNNTSYTILVQITSDIVATDTNSFDISPNSSKTIMADYGIIPIFTLTVVGQSNLKVRYSKYDSLSQVVLEGTYEYEVQYKISGTANSVDITLSNATGGTEQYTDVLLPKEYDYSTFSDNFLYISGNYSAPLEGWR